MQEGQKEGEGIIRTLSCFPVLSCLTSPADTLDHSDKNGSRNDGAQEVTEQYRPCVGACDYGGEDRVDDDKGYNAYDHSD